MAENKTAENNISLGINTRQRFTIDGDRNRVIMLDTHDIALVNRLSESIKRIDDLKAEWEKLEALNNTEIAEGDEVSEATLNEISVFSDQFKVIEQKMRNIVDFIFDSEGLCETVVGNSSVFSPVNGKYKFEQIIDVLTGLYEESIKKEADKINKRTVEAKTSKYIRKTDKAK